MQTFTRLSFGTLLAVAAIAPASARDAAKVAEIAPASQQVAPVSQQVVPVSQPVAPKAVATGAAAVVVPAPDAQGPAAATQPASAAGKVGAATRGELNVLVDRAKVIRLPDRTQTVVIGNPAIADITIQKNGVAVVTGKSYGVTNVIALDNGGNLLAESIVSVSAPTDSVLVVQRGLERQSYSCTPACQPSVVLGDANAFFSETRGQADQRNAFASGRN
ncbi:MAG: pilus assembly protein N-terminal domain-containing protein [Methylobacteriaceae bacterium]|nr:pilus assembly protein N-terminal domain-containing protein [Methylobacteriaceae bacterium]